MKQEDIQKAMEALGKGGIMVNGDLVLEKHVEHEIGNVEAGGIGIQINYNGRENDAPAEDAKEADNEALVAQLLPIFYNNESDVRQFLKEIEGMATQDITDVVNRWVKDKRISDYGNSRKGVLWGILHDAGLYLKSKTNWNGRVK